MSHFPYERLLLDHVVRPWFPRSIDREFGGFLCDFDWDWSPAGPQDKHLEFQARQTLTAAELSWAYPGEAALSEAMASGFEVLSNVLWDVEYGGWYLRADRSGRPLDGGRKHAHGSAYAIEACAAVYAVTGNERALELVKTGFEWLDANAWDALHGGYFGPMERDGTITSGGRSGAVDHVGTPLGLKDTNVNKDMLSAVAYGARVCPHGRMRQRFDQLLVILHDRWRTGDLPNFLFRADWTPVSDLWRPSETAQAAGILVESRSLCSRPDDLEATAARLLYRAYEQGRLNGGGLLFSAHADGAQAEESNAAPWWAQLELLRAAEYMRILRPQDAGASAIANAARGDVLRYVDHKWGGFTDTVPTARSKIERLLGFGRRSRGGRKAHRWKDASHEGRVLLRLAGRAPPWIAADVPCGSRELQALVQAPPSVHRQ